MRIIGFEVKNFRSLRDVKLEPLGNLVVLVGRNGVGKSNILEALELFFSDLNFQTEAQKQFDPSTWYDRRADRRIEFKARIHLTHEDLSSIVPAQFQPATGLTDWPEGGMEITIHRAIDTNIWKNLETRIGDILTIKEGKVTLQMPEGRGGVVPSEAANQLLTSLNAHLKNEFKLIRGPRESAERPPAGNRPPVVDAETKSRLVQTAVSPKREEEDNWNQLEAAFRDFSERELRVRVQALEVRNQGLSLPIEAAGSGDQALVILLRWLLGRSAFIGIEEPETRLHNDYQRRLFALMRRMSETTQIFIATHSAVFVDRDLFDDTWLVTLRGNESIVTRSGVDQFKAISLELGIRPSDILLANSILLVEGNTEKVAIPMIAQKLGISIANVSIVPTHGKSNQRYHLKVWSQAARSANLGIFALLDGDAEAEIKSLLRDHLIDRDSYHLLGSGAADGGAREFEELLPRDKLVSVVKHILADESVHREKGWESAVEKLSTGPVGPTLESIFGKWPPKARIVVETIDASTPEDLRQSADELVRFIQKIR